MCVQSAQTKQVAVLSVHARLKKAEIVLFRGAVFAQNVSLLQTGHLSTFPTTSTVCGSFFRNNFILVIPFSVIVTLNMLKITLNGKETKGSLFSDYGINLFNS